METLSLIFAMLAVAFIGCNVLYLVSGRLNRLSILETAPAAYGLGIGCISLEMLIAYILGFSFSVAGLLSPWILLFIINAVHYFRSGDNLLFHVMPCEKKEKHGYLNIFLISGIAIETAYAFFRALIKPIESYDAVAIYAIKSKIFFLSRAIPGDYFSNLAKMFPHPDYPLNIPLAETFFYMAMKSLNDQLVKIIFPLFFVGILCLLYCAVRRFASRTYALLFTFLLASIPQFNAYAANAYQDLPLAFYYFISVLFLLNWIEDREDVRSLVLSAIMIGFAGWTKNEGLLYCVINITIVMALAVASPAGGYKKNIFAPVFYMAVMGIILAPWIWIKHKYGIANEEINLLNLNPAYLVKQLPKAGPIFYELQKQLFGPKKWNILWIAVIVVSVLNFKKIFSGAQKYISISIILAMCGYIVFYMISYVDVVFFASKTWSRFLLHFLPLLMLWLAYILREDVKI